VGNNQIDGKSRQAEPVNVESQEIFSPFRLGSVPL
jgi:hypothetical protein